jgi:hypothetical protein
VPVTRPFSGPRALSIARLDIITSFTEATMATAAQHTGPVKTDIPARMDRLPCSRWHWTVVIRLGITCGARHGPLTLWQQGRL